MGVARLSILVVAASLWGLAITASAESTGTAFTFQGQLKQGGIPVNGTFEFDVGLWTASAPDGDQLGSQVVQAEVRNGLFTLKLNEGGLLGANAFNGDARWLEIAVCRPPDDCTNPANHSTLLPRQELTPSPYAVHAATGAGGSLWTVKGSDIHYTNGNVGIGTTDPFRPLHILGASPNVPGDGQLRIDSSETTGAVSTGVGLWFTGHDGNSQFTLGAIQALKENSTVGNTASFFRITTRTNGGPPTERMRIDSNGNVGIGTIDPDSKLHVKTSGGGIHVEAGGSDTAEVYLSEGNDSGIKMVYSGPDNSLSFVPRLTGTDSPAALTIKRGTGYVGIGTTNPGHMLEIEGDDPDIGLDVSSTSNSNAQLRFMVDNTEKADVAYIKAQERLQLTNRASGSAKRLVLDRDGNVGIGTAEPTPAKLKVVANSDFAALEVRQGGHGFAGAFVNTNPVGIGPALFVEHKGLGPVIQAVSSGNVVFQVLASGTTSVEVLQITGPDLAEKFPFTGEAKPGMVVQIDSDNPGGLRVATGAYNRMVAGIVSNAGGLSAGAILGNLPGSEDQPPIALSGRVWTLCDASLGVIKPGDLLTTCDTPGHAMKVTNHTRAQGAIIGKAMTSLAEGKGLVLVLVSLQ